MLVIWMQMMEKKAAASPCEGSFPVKQSNKGNCDSG